jgi:hypothetical protein
MFETHGMFCSFTCSKMQPDEYLLVSKHVAVRILYKVVLSGYLFVTYFIVQHSGMRNFKI